MIKQWVTLSKWWNLGGGRMHIHFNLLSFYRDLKILIIKWEIITRQIYMYRYELNS